MPCQGNVCGEGEGRIEGELPSQAIPVSAMSQCAAPQFCDASTPGTGHERGLFPELTDGIVAVEQCYSYCFSKVRSPRRSRTNAESPSLIAYYAQMMGNMHIIIMLQYTGLNTIGTLMLNAVDIGMHIFEKCGAWQRYATTLSCSSARTC